MTTERRDQRIVTLPDGASWNEDVFRAYLADLEHPRATVRRLSATDPMCVEAERVSRETAS